MLLSTKELVLILIFSKIKKGIFLREINLFDTLFKKVILVFFYLLNRQINKKHFNVFIVPNPAFRLSASFSIKDKVYNEILFLPHQNINFFSRLGFDRAYEGLKITRLKPNCSKVIKFSETNKLLLPIAIIDNKCFGNSPSKKIDFLLNGTKKSINILYSNRFNYIPIKSTNKINKIKVSSENSLIAIGKPFSQKIITDEESPKLIFHILLDSLPQSLLDLHGFELMPNTNRFFGNLGVKFTNIYAQSEWTLPSVAGIFTGLYTNEHLDIKLLASLACQGCHLLKDIQKVLIDMFTPLIIKVTMF